MKNIDKVIRFSGALAERKKMRYWLIILTILLGLVASALLVFTLEVGIAKADNWIHESWCSIALAACCYIAFACLIEHLREKNYKDFFINYESFLDILKEDIKKAVEEGHLSMLQEFEECLKIEQKDEFHIFARLKKIPKKMLDLPNETEEQRKRIEEKLQNAARLHAEIHSKWIPLSRTT